MIFQYLPEADKLKIEKYIDKWVGSNARGLPNSLEYVLRHWDYNKEKFYHLFGDRFIIKKYIEWDLSDEDKSYRMKDALAKSDAISNFVADFKYNAAKHFSETDYCNIIDLVEVSNLSDNAYCGENFSVFEPVSGKKIQVQKGASTVKIIAKFARAWDMEEKFEKMRCAHSNIIGTNKIRGNLCLSIHPLDFMTMSDNDSDWTSCMSWTDSGKGCYKQGTVEMMNSPYAVLAYLESSTPYYLGFDEKIKDNLWNNKKWREIILVDEDFITPVKDYPFHNARLEKLAADWLAELMTEAGGTFFPPCEVEPFKDNVYRGCNYRLDFTTDHMYNDFDNLYNSCYMYLSDRLINPNNAPVKKKSPAQKLLSFVPFSKAEVVDLGTIVIHYSGVSECVWCGDYLHDEEGEFEIFDSRLLCNDCGDFIYCCCCGDDVPANDVVEFNGNTYCTYCYNENIGYDDITDDEEFYDDMRYIHLLENKNQTEKIYRGTHSIQTAVDIEDIYDTPIYRDVWTRTHYVLIDECSPELLAHFGINNESDLQDYLDHLKTI